MELSAPLLLDNGFLRRQCPSCDRQFKWHHGPTEDRPDDTSDPPMYYCPYCGVPAESDKWLTHEQVDYLRRFAAGAAKRVVVDELEAMARRHSSKHLKLSVQSGSTPETPPPAEPQDMIAVASPCHPWEPVKITDTWQEPVRCLICGEPFATS